MSSKSKTKQAEATEAPLSAKDFPMADFIPYAVFYNDHTLLTKNGELVQTFKIPLTSHGLPSEDADHTGIYIRELIRKMVGACLTSPDYSHWLHIFRERTPIAPLTEPNGEFAAALQKEWLGSQRTAYSYQNVCYISVVMQGQSANLFDMRDYQKGSTKRKNRKFRLGHIDQQAQRLEKTMGMMMTGMAEHFQVERLAMASRVDEHGVKAYYSEQMEWLHRLVNLREMAMPVSETDISQQLETSELIFGFDAMESRQGKDKRFTSLLSLKHYHELPVELLDRFLQLPLEMVITQASHFIDAQKVMEEESVVAEVLQHSEDGFITEKSGFADVVHANQGGKTDFSSQQTTLMIVTDDYSELDELTIELQSEIAKLGLLSVREDIKLEEIFWSQLPANYEFLRRMQGLPSSKVDGLARLNFYPTGEHESRWGEPITMLPTATRTPYLFHFHRGASGHTALIDFNSFADAIGYRLVHFLAAAASKQISRTIIFDRHGAGEMFVNAMGGHYARLGGKAHNLTLNPLAMECVPANQGFLAAWIAMLLDVTPEDEAARNAIRACVGKGWNNQTASGGFGELVAMMQDVDATMADQLRSYMQRPVFGGAMVSGLDNLQLDAAMSAVNLHVDTFKEASAIAMFSLLLHRTILTLDGKPTLLIIKDAWDVLDHPFFGSRLQSLLDMLTEKNAVLMVTARDPQKLAASMVTPIVMAASTTKIIIPDDIPGDYLTDTLGISKTEERKLNQMERQRGEVLVVHGEEIITTKIEMKDATRQAILSGDAKTLQAMKSA